MQQECHIESGLYIAELGLRISMKRARGPNPIQRTFDLFPPLSSGHFAEKDSVELPPEGLSGGSMIGDSALVRGLRVLLLLRVSTTQCNILILLLS